MWPSGSARGPAASAATTNSTPNGANNTTTTGTGSSGGGGGVGGPQPSFSGLRVNDQRVGAAANQRWLDHQQAQQWNSQGSQWAPHAGGPAAPQPWPLANATQPWQGAPSSNTGTGGSTYAEHAKKNMVSRGGGHSQVQGRYDQQQQHWGQVKVDQQTPWDTGSLAGFSSVHDTKSTTTEWGSGSSSGHVTNTRWGPPAATQWPLHAAATSSTAAPDWAAAVAAAAAAVHRHDAAGTPWNSTAAAPHPTAAALLPQPAAAWGQAPGVAQQPTAAALQNPSEQYDPNPQTPGPWVAPQPQEMNNDMMWHDPNPKQKKVQRDTGTAIWGDPQQQPVEIKRWKDAELDDYSHVQSAIPCGGDWNSIPVSSNGSICGTAGNSGTGTGTGHTTNSCCSATGTNVSTPTTTVGCVGANGPWPEGSHPEPTSAAAHQERWHQQHSAWGDKLDNPVENHHPPDLLSGPPAMGGGIGMHGLMDSTMIRPDIGIGGIAAAAPYSTLTQQIAEQIRIAVNKGLIDVAMLSHPPPQNALVILNVLLQKLPKLEQAQQEYQQVLRTMTSPAQKIESERLAVEINGLHREILQLRNAMNEQLLKARPNSILNGTLPPLQQQQQDGQSRLQQWKQANAQDCNNDKLCTSASDPNVPGLIASAQGMSLDDKIDWKSGALDWSPPPGSVDKGPDGMDKDDRSSSACDSKQLPVASSSTNQSGTGTPTPQQTQSQTQAPPIDDGPQEFVPGKKWEWRDPNKVAEDPNATPGTCKPNPLLTTSSTGQPFQLYGGGNNSPHQGGSGSTGTTATNFLTDLQTMNRTASSGYLGWNGGAGTIGNPVGNFGSNDLWPTPAAGTLGAATRQSRVAPGPAGIGPFAHAAVARGGPGGSAGPAIGPFQRSLTSPFSIQQPQPHQWLFVQLHGVNESQVLMLCQKVGQIMQTVCPPGAPFLCVKFMEPVEEVIRRLKVEAPFLQVKPLLESEMERLLKLRAAIPYGGPLGPAAGAEPWMFGAMLPGGAGAADLLPQQPHFHAGDATNDLTRPF